MKRLYRVIFFFDPETLELVDTGMDGDHTYTDWSPHDGTTGADWKNALENWDGKIDSDGLNICVEMEVEEP